MILCNEEKPAFYEFEQENMIVKGAVPRELVRYNPASDYYVSSSKNLFKIREIFKSSVVSSASKTVLKQ